MNAEFKRFFKKISSITPVSYRNSKSKDEMANSGNNNDSGNKSKTSSWDEVGFLKNEFRKGSKEKEYKDRILELCETAGISTISQFYDIVFKAQREFCSHTLFGEEGECWDSTGEDVAYSLDSIEEAFELKKPKCSEICNLGCCASQNRLAFNILNRLTDIVYEDK